MTDRPVRLAEGSLVVLVGPPASGKSTWAAEHFPAGQVVSSDDLRAVVGTGPHDQRASKDAFDVLDLVVERRLRRGLTTVVDSLGTDARRRRRWREAAERAGVPCVAVVFDVDPAVCRARNRGRAQPVPAKVLSSMLAAWPGVRDGLDADGFAALHVPGPVAVVAPDLVTAPAAARRQKEDPMRLEFGLQIPRFAFPGGPAETRARLSDIAAAAEDAGFAGLWVMDHMLQIPTHGPHWEDMLDSWTTLAFLAGRTERVRLGTLVTGITYRNIAHLAKIVATLDVLSGGRANCGLGAAWFEREHRAYGWRFPPRAERFAALEDALELLPLMWGKGAPAFAGRTIEVPEAVCYPRPLQEHVPILVGGSGERVTLRLVARHADACNLFGDPDTVRRKVAVLHRHCAAVDRDPAEVTVTHLSTADAPTVDDHVGRYRLLAEAGVQTEIVSLPGLAGPEPVAAFAEVIAAFA
ncbi:MAG TPA: TIGR03560 family F420-dependent LLM class oxidoreductase [Acidimicrobiales bacterium]|nr:TIGR03560 family F420-dependent LLM class oxidoreductase [Acidimicrobiales bacterium]